MAESEDVPRWVRWAANRMDDDAVQDAVLTMIKDKAYPHLEDIRERAREAESKQEVRDVFEEMSEAERNELFHHTWAELITSLFQLRVDPVDGYQNLKSMIRDPYTMEAMLLIMDHDTIPDETQEAQKDLLSQYLHWMGIAVAPEMYEREQVEQMIGEFGGDPELLEEYDENVDAAVEKAGQT